MTGSIPPVSPLAYEGAIAVPFITRTFNPQTTFNSFPIATIWINTMTSEAFILVSKALGVAVWLALGGPAGGLDTLTTPDSVVVVPTSGNINFLNGTAMNITGAGSNITFNSTGGGFQWNDIGGISSPMLVGNGYVADNGALVTLTLPAVAAFGQAVAVTSNNTGGWTIAQNAGQQINIGQFSTTIGVGGSLSSTQKGDTVLLLCTTANTTFTVLSMVGNITFV